MRFSNPGRVREIEICFPVANHYLSGRSEYVPGSQVVPQLVAPMWVQRPEVGKTHIKKVFFLVVGPLRV